MARIPCRGLFHLPISHYNIKGCHPSVEVSFVLGLTIYQYLKASDLSGIPPGRADTLFFIVYTLNLKVV